MRDKTQIIPEMLRLMSPEDQLYWSQQLGLPLPPEAAQIAKTEKKERRHDRLAEIDQQKKFLTHLERLEYAYVWHRADKPSTANVGVADFVITIRGGRSLAIEFKVQGGKLSPMQEEWKRRHEARGGVYLVVHTYQEAMSALAVEESRQR